MVLYSSVLPSYDDLENEKSKKKLPEKLETNEDIKEFLGLS
jgi:hypothetical protein